MGMCSGCVVWMCSGCVVWMCSVAVVMLFFQDCVAALLSYTGVRDVSDAEGRSALMWAAQKGNVNSIRTLLEMAAADVHMHDQLGATGDCEGVGCGLMPCSITHHWGITRTCGTSMTFCSRYSCRPGYDVVATCVCNF